MTADLSRALLPAEQRDDIQKACLDIREANHKSNVADKILVGARLGTIFGALAYAGWLFGLNPGLGEVGGLLALCVAIIAPIIWCYYNNIQKVVFKQKQDSMKILESIGVRSWDGNRVYILDKGGNKISNDLDPFVTDSYIIDNH